MQRYTYFSFSQMVIEKNPNKIALSITFFGKSKQIIVTFLSLNTY